METSSKPQIVYIHGGDSFDTDEEFYNLLHTMKFDPYAAELKTWRQWLEIETIDTHEFIYVAMPNKLNADYTAWAIWFDKVVPYLRDGATLIGYSLGGGFLLRYLTENILPIKLRQLHLVATVVDNKDCSGVGDFKIDLATWHGFKNDINEVHLWHSSDDPYVPFHHSERFLKVFPRAIHHTLTERGHFFQPEFPELLKEILKQLP